MERLAQRIDARAQYTQARAQPAVLLSMSRKLAAVLAVRNNGSRLYGKPLQKLTGNTTILEQIVSALRTFPVIEEIVLAIAAGSANAVFEDVARELKCRYVVGDPVDVLGRLIEGARVGEASDVFRVTTECPFFDYTQLDRAWARHVEAGSSITVLANVPRGTSFEIYTVEALSQAHREGNVLERENLDYPVRQPERFVIDVLEPAQECRRLDLRLTVDYPEDLILCRAVAEEFRSDLPRPSLVDIITFLDGRRDLVDLVAPYVSTVGAWGNLS